MSEVVSRLCRRGVWFAAYTAAFALLGAFVFWGTWSTSVVPVMPDCATVHPLDWGVRLSRWAEQWLQNGRATPFDLVPLVISPYVWQELQFVVYAYLAGLALAYFLVGRGLARVAAFGAGLLLGFSGYWFTLFSAGHLSWFQWMAYGLFAFGLCDRAVRGGALRHWLLLGATQAWASHWQVDMWLLFAVFISVYLVWCCVRERKWPRWTGVLAAAALFAAVGLPAFMDAFGNALSGRDRQIEESKGSVLSGGEKKDDAEARWVFATNWSMPPEDTLEFFVPRVHGDTSCPMTLSIGQRNGNGVKPYTGRLGRPLNARAGNYRQHSLYVGWITCLLALVGLGFGLKSRRGEVAFFAAAALVFWLFSMGRFCEPVYRLVYALPFGDYLRAPVKWHHLTEFCLAVLAGHGLQALADLAFVRRMGALGAGALALVAFFGACDLARVDALYCAPIDIALVKAANPAADEVTRRGGGKVADMIQGGRGPLGWSFHSHCVDTTEPGDAAARFVWVASGQLKDEGVARWVREKKAAVIGAYAVGSRSIGRATGGNANVLLMEIPGVPAPAKSSPAARPLYVALGALSALASLAMLALIAKMLARACGSVGIRDGHPL